MEDTCSKKECALYKKLKLKNIQECPNYIENIFIDNKTGSKIIVSDCATIRIVLNQNSMINTLYAIQKDIEELRNQVNAVNIVTKNIMLEAEKQLQKTSPIYIEG